MFILKLKLNSLNICLYQFLRFLWSFMLHIKGWPWRGSTWKNIYKVKFLGHVCCWSFFGGYISQFINWWAGILFSQVRATGVFEKSVSSISSISVTIMKHSKVGENHRDYYKTTPKKQKHTVDGRTSAPVGMVNIPFCNGFYTSQLRYSGDGCSINSMGFPAQVITLWVAGKLRSSPVASWRKARFWCVFFGGSEFLQLMP